MSGLATHSSLSPAPSAVISPGILHDHIRRASEAMRHEEIDALVLFRASNILAFTGVPLEPSDRLVCGLLTADGRLALLCPEFEASAAHAMPAQARLVTWQEHEDPYAALGRTLAELQLERAVIALDGHTWSATAGRIRENINGAQTVLDPGIIERVRLLKSPAEIAAIENACRVTAEIYPIIAVLLQPGLTELELQNEATRRFTQLGHAPGHGLFQAGPNAAVPHRAAGLRPMTEGDCVVCDWVARSGGYHGDLTRTFAIGRPSSRARAAYQAVRAAQKAAIQSCRPGIACEAVDAAARKTIADAGFGDFFIHRLGHGIGLDFHEPPYLVAGNRQPLEPGMCVTIEPGIYVPGEFGVRIEDVVAITPDGCQALSAGVPTDVSSAFAP